VLACNISDLDPSKGLHALLGGGEAEILCQLSAFRHTPEVPSAPSTRGHASAHAFFWVQEYANDFALMLHDSRCTVREHLVAQSMQRKVSASFPKALSGSPLGSSLTAACGGW
jgi:hypothetical protein